MSGERFIVAHVAGFRGGSGQSKPGVSAHVVDTACNHEVVASFRSEDRATGVGQAGRNIGVLGALQAAEAEAKRLNEWAARDGVLG